MNARPAGAEDDRGSSPERARPARMVDDCHPWRGASLDIDLHIKVTDSVEALIRNAEVEVAATLGRASRPWTGADGPATVPKRASLDAARPDPVLALLQLLYELLRRLVPLMQWTCVVAEGVKGQGRQTGLRGGASIGPPPAEGARGTRPPRAASDWTLACNALGVVALGLRAVETGLKVADCRLLRPGHGESTFSTGSGDWEDFRRSAAARAGPDD